MTKTKQQKLKLKRLRRRVVEAARLWRGSGGDDEAEFASNQKLVGAVEALQAYEEALAKLELTVKTPSPELVEKELDELVERVLVHSPYLGRENVVALVADRADARAQRLFMDRPDWMEDLRRSKRI